MSDVIELHDIEALNDFQSDWTRLLAITPGGDVFPVPGMAAGLLETFCCRSEITRADCA